MGRRGRAAPLTDGSLNRNAVDVDGLIADADENTDRLLRQYPRPRRGPSRTGTKSPWPNSQPGSTSGPGRVPGRQTPAEVYAQAVVSEGATVS